MTLYRIASDRAALEAVGPTSFAAEKLAERADLQRLLRKHIEAIGEDLLVVAEEYALFEDSRRRVDLLAVDRSGTLVVIELKRTDDGGHMELQALRYAAMVSTMSFTQLVETHAHYNHLDIDAARNALADWFEETTEAEDLPDHVRIILVSADFSTEVTSTVLWLNQQYGTDISCFRLSPYRLDDSVLLDIQQIVPLPEAADFQIQQRRKGATAAAARAADGRDFTKYALRMGQQVLPAMSKKSAVRKAVELVHDAGTPLTAIRQATLPTRWIKVTPHVGEGVEAAFRRENPGRGNGYWFDLNLRESDHAWVMPHLGGRRTEEFLGGLAEATNGALKWQAVSAVSGADTLEVGQVADVAGGPSGQG